MSFTHVGGAGSANTTYQAGTKSLSYSPTAGNLIVYGAVAFGTIPSPTFRDSASNNLTTYLYSIGNFYVFIGWEIVPSGITGFTATWGYSGPTDCVFVDEFSTGGGTVSANGSIIGAWGTTGTTASAASVGSSGDLVYALCGLNFTGSITGQGPITVGSGFTFNPAGALAQDASNFYNPAAAAEYAANIGSAVTPSCGITMATGGGTWWIASQAFSLAGGGVAPTSANLGGASIGFMNTKSGAITVTLDQPAGVGGVSVTVTSSNASDSLTSS